MNNPWLNIPASDYEGHMGLPGVDQLSFLAGVFRDALVEYDSRSIAYLGCTTGNGLEHIDTRRTHRLTAIDLNPEYLAILRDRYQDMIPGLETIEADLNDVQELGQQYSLIFAGLLFEYLSPAPLLKKIASWLGKTGVLVVVLQLACKQTRKVSDTPYFSLKQLAPIMNLISAQDFRLMARESGLKEVDGRTVTLASGKTFYIGVYGKNT